MRELDKGDLEQFNALLQYAFQVTSYDLFQTGWKQDEIKYAKRPILEEAYVLGWFYRDRLASNGISMQCEVTMSDLRISGAAPSAKLNLLLNSLYSLTVDRNPDRDAYDYFRKCEYAKMAAGIPL